jgi:hypothetical protein
VEVAAALASESAGAGAPVALERSLRPLTQAILLSFSRSCLHVLHWCLPSCRAVGRNLPWACTCSGMGVSDLELDGRQEKSKRSHRSLRLEDPFLGREQ